MDIPIIVGTAVKVPVNVLPLIDDGDFKTIEDSVAYNASGMDLRWNFVTPAGVMTSTAVTPTTSGDYDWTHKGDGMYEVEMPASGGASINNNTIGVGWFSGRISGVLPFRGPVIGCMALRTAARETGLFAFNEYGGIIIHVATTGNDSNIGTASSPKLTVNGAIAVAQPFDTIYVNDGTYGAFDASGVMHLTIEGQSRAGTICTTSSGPAAKLGHWGTLRRITVTSTHEDSTGLGLHVQAKHGCLVEFCNVNGTYDAIGAESSTCLTMKASQFVGTYDGGNTEGTYGLVAIGCTFSTLGTWVGPTPCVPYLVPCLTAVERIAAPVLGCSFMLLSPVLLASAAASY